MDDARKRREAKWAAKHESSGTPSKDDYSKPVLQPGNEPSEELGSKRTTRAESLPAVGEAASAMATLQLDPQSEL